MKSKTMFSTAVCCSDEFRDMSPEAQALYLQMNLSADGDGFVDGMKSFMRAICASQDSLDELITAGFILVVEGVHLIRHWWVNNNRDRMHDTHGCHVVLLEQLAFESDNYRAYCFREPPDEDCDAEEDEDGRLQVADNKSLIELKTKPIKKSENRNYVKVDDQLNPLIPAEALEQRAWPYRMAPCPKCGVETLVTTTPPYYGLCDEHGYFNAPGG